MRGRVSTPRRSTSSRLFKALLRLFPLEFRDAFGRDMERLFRDEQRAAREAGGASSLRLSLRTVVDVLSTAPGQQLDTLRQDLLHTFRLMRRSPGFTLGALLLVAIVIGANTAIFSMLHAVLLRPFPYRQPGQIVTVWERNVRRNLTQSRVSPPNFVEWRARNEAFSHIVAMSEQHFHLQTPDGPQSVGGMAVSAELFDLLGVTPRLGRLFTRDDERTDGVGVAIISHGLWQRHFGRSPRVVGQTLLSSDRSFVVIGVLPETFWLPWPNAENLGQPEIWVPLAFEPAELAETMRGARYLTTLARLRPGLTVSDAESRMRVLARQIANARGTHRDWDVAVVPFREHVVSGARRSLVLLGGAVACVLLIACANLASLLLVRTIARRQEMAVRAALGASHLRVCRQLLTESITLALLGGALGVLLAKWALPALIELAPRGVPRLEQVGVDRQVLLFTGMLSLVTGVLCGVAPALRASVARLSETLRSSGHAALAPLTSRLRSPLVATEIALTLILLTGAALLTRSVIALQRVDLGFNAANVLTAFLALPEARYPTDNALRAAFARLTDDLAALPGVEVAAAGLNLPLTGSSMLFAFSKGGELEPSLDRTAAQYHRVTGGYFRAMGVPLLHGRPFDRRDSERSRPVAVVNTSLAHRLWPDESAVGKRITVVSEQGPTTREIVGVVGDLKHGGPASEAVLEIYVPYRQAPRRFMYLIVRATDRNPALPGQVRAAVGRFDRALPVEFLQWMDERLSGLLAPVRFQLRLLGLFAAAALMLALTCVYAVVSHSVSLRVKELGIRLALGANRRQLIWLVLRQAAQPATIGLIAGLAGAALATRFLRAQLFDVSPTDPLTFAATALLLFLAVLAAACLPAYRATKLDPVQALRAE